MSQRLLFVDPEGLAIFTRRRARLQAELELLRDEQGFRKFSAYLDTQGQASFDLLANLPGEQQAEENLPRLPPRERRQLLSRRCEQRFPAPTLHCIQPHPDDDRKARDERLLIAALPYDGDLAPWIECMQQQNVALAGIFSPTQLAASLLQRSRLPLPQDALLLMQLRQELRISYLRHGQTQFSRLLRVGSAWASAATIIDEAHALQRHLIAQRRIEHTTRLPVFVFCERSAAEVLQTQDENAALVFRPITTGAGSSSPCATTCRGEYDLLEQLSRHRPKQAFSPNPLGARHTERLLRRALIGVSAGICLSTSAYAAMNLTALRAIETGRLQQERRVAELHEHGAALETELRRYGLPPEKLPAIIARHKERLGRQGDFPRLLGELSRTWEACPGLTLDTLDWQAHENATQSPEQHLSLVGHTDDDGAAANTTCLAAEISHLANCRSSTGTLPADAGATGERGFAPEERSAGFAVNAVCHR